MNFFRNSIAAICAGGMMSALLVGAPARADEDTFMGQPAPKTYLLNKMFSRKSLGLTDSAPNGTQPAGANGQVAGANGKAAPADDDDDNGTYPKRYLLNQMFGDK